MNESEECMHVEPYRNWDKKEMILHQSLEEGDNWDQEEAFFHTLPSSSNKNKNMNMNNILFYGSQTYPYPKLGTQCLKGWLHIYRKAKVVSIFLWNGRSKLFQNQSLLNDKIKWFKHKFVSQFSSVPFLVNFILRFIFLIFDIIQILL